jgi:hypothetical protein
MKTNERAENARAAAEAAEAVAKRESSGHHSAVEDVLKRYLAAEAFHERRREDEASTGTTRRPDVPRGT